MLKKLALSDDEITLRYILILEGAGIDEKSLVELYGDVLPSLKDNCGTMLDNIKNCNWSKSDFDETLSKTPLSLRLDRLVECAFISARNISDAYSRGKQAHCMISKFFRKKERSALLSRIDEESAFLAQNMSLGRKPDDAVLSLLTSGTGLREDLRRRAAMARARGLTQTDNQAADVSNERYRNISVEEAVKRMFPDGLREVSPIAVRIALSRVNGESVTKKAVEDAIMRVCVV